MGRTTINIDTPLLRDLKLLQKKEGKSLSTLVSELLVQGLARRRSAKTPTPSFHWVSRPMRALVDVTDKDALYNALERSAHEPPR